MGNRTIIPFGPQHPVLPEPIHIDLVVEDEKVVEAVPSIGFIHRGLEKLVEKAHKNPDILIYAIGILGEEDKREAGKAKRALDSLTKASGGFSLYPKDIGEVESMAQQVAPDIRNQYVLAYSPTNQNLDGTFRQIKVTAGKYTVRTRTGYYATPEDQKKHAVAPSPGK